jgi:Ca2+-binding RTX toxin-like protein
VAGTWFDDVLKGNNADNTLFGSFGDDTLSGGKGDDVLVGGEGIAGAPDNDYLDGGAGYDVARFTGSLSDYSFQVQADGKIVVTDLRPGSPDGTDTLVNVEALEFGPIQFDSRGDLVPAPDVPIAAALGYAQLHDHLSGWIGA